MKIGGKAIKPLQEDAFVIIRDNEEYPILIKPVDIRKFEFDDPLPKPPQKITPSAGQVPNYEDPGYKANLKDREARFFSWLIISAIKDTPGLEWDKVRYDEPISWQFYESDLRDGGLTERELQQLVVRIVNVQGINDVKMEAARQHFLATIKVPNQNPG